MRAILVVACVLFGAAAQGETERAAQKQLDEQVRGKPAQDPKDNAQIHSMVMWLDQPSTDIGELRRLGLLAVPWIHRYFDQLGPVGMRRGVELLVQFPDARLVPLLARLLGDAERGLRALAAEQIGQLPVELAEPLAAQAAKSSDPLLQAEALHHRARAGAERAPLVGALAPLVRTGDPMVRKRVAAMR